MDNGVDDGDVARLMEYGCTADQAHFLLEACAGNFNRALSMYRVQARTADLTPPGAVSLQIAEQVAPLAPQIRPRGIPPRPRAPHGHLQPPGPTPFPLQLANAALSLPFSILAFTLRFTARSVGFGFGILGALARRVLPPRVTDSLRAIAAGAPEQSPATAAVAFAQNFESRYGPRHPRWEACGWQEAATRAHNDGKLLFVYLHSPHHQDAHRFCRDTLCSPAFIDYVNSTFLPWGGDLRSTDAYRLATSLRAAAYPYCALLALSGTRTRLVVATEGALRPEALAEALQAALVEHGAVLRQELAERERRETDRRLRQEQDEEFQRSLAEDRERERRESQAREAAEAEERRLEEEARRAAEEAAAEERRKAEAAAALAARRETKLAALPEEPSAEALGTALIRVRLPSGASHQRRFMGTDSLQAVCDWVDSLDSHAHLRYALATTYPRRVLAGPDMLAKSLQKLELTPQAALLVQPEDT